jgi:hypothetical protein
MRHLVLLSMVVLLSGCMPALKSSDMQPIPSVFDVDEYNGKLVKNVDVGTVIVPENISSIYATVTQPQFKEAVSLALRLGMLANFAGQASDYVLDATIEKIDQPLMGFSMTVDTAIKYRLYERESQQRLYVRILPI